MKNSVKVFRNAVITGLCFFSFAIVSGNNEIYSCNDMDSLLILMEETVVDFEPEMEVEAWMIEPFELQTEIFADQKAVVEPELEVEPWMIEAFVTTTGQYAYQDKKAL